MINPDFIAVFLINYQFPMEREPRPFNFFGFPSQSQVAGSKIRDYENVSQIIWMSHTCLPIIMEYGDIIQRLTEKILHRVVCTKNVILKELYMVFFNSL